MLRVLARNICSNWIGFAVNGLVTFFLTPFVLDSIGGTQYGIWVLITSLTGYYGLLTVGIGAGTTQQLTMASSAGSQHRFNQLASTAVVALTGCGIAICVAAVVMSLSVPYLFSVPVELTRETRLCVLIIGTAAGFQFALFPFSAVFTAKQRYDLSNTIGISMRVLSAVVVYFALRKGGGLVALCTIAASTDSLGSVIRWMVARRLIPTLKIRLSLVERASLSRLTKLSLWNALIAGGQNLNATAGILVIGVVISDAAIAPYSIALSLMQLLLRPLSAAAIVFYPAATELFSKADAARLQRMYLTGAKMMALLGIAVGVPGILWSREFYNLWIPDQLTEWTQFPPLESLFLILMVSEVLVAPWLLGHQIILGAHRIKLLAALTWAEGLLGFGLCGTLATQYGLLGIATGTACATIIFRAFLYQIVLLRMLKITAWDCVGHLVLRPVLAAGVLFPLLWLFHRLVGAADSWPMFFASASAAGVLALIVCVVVGTTLSEREWLIAKPLARLSRYMGIESRTETTEADTVS